jgi:hypothetical protein
MGVHVDAGGGERLGKGVIIHPGEGDAVSQELTVIRGIAGHVLPISQIHRGVTKPFQTVAETKTLDGEILGYRRIVATGGGDHAAR